MTCEFSAEERELLLRILEEHHRQLEREMWKTNHRSFKEQIRGEQGMVEKLLTKLGAGVVKPT